MGAWAGLTLSVDTLKGLARTDWGGKAQGDVNTSIVAQAKQLIENLLARRIGAFIVSGGGTEAFFDRLAAKAEAASDLQNAVGYAYLFSDYADLGNRPGVGPHDVAKARLYFNPDGAGGKGTGLLVTVVDALAETAPALVGESTESPRSYGGSTTVSYQDRYAKSGLLR